MSISIKRFLSALLCTLAVTLASVSPASAEDNFGYYGFEPDIITNYINNKKKFGYIRVTVELMLTDVDNWSIVDHHSPLLRDAIVDILTKESEEKIKSLTGREEIRRKCVDKLKELLKKETGQEVIKDIFFTKYLYH